MRFAAALLFLLAAFPLCAQRAEPPNGVLLVAKPSLIDPNFRETVVLVTQAPDGSTVGVVLNRPTTRRSEKSGEPIYTGGPVMPEVTLALFSAERAPAATAFQVTQGVYLSMHPVNIDALPSAPGQRLRFFTGFSGWAPGQLQRELRLDAWFVMPVTEEILFRADTRGMWKDLLDRANGARTDWQIQTGYTGFMNAALRLLAALMLFASAGMAAAQSDDGAILLVAHPAFRDLEYRQTVLLAAPAPSGGHVGVILNRPTKRSLGSLFPEHEPSKKVVEPVYYGGPFSRGALVALVRADQTPGTGSVLLMRNLYMTFRANTIDHVIETTPNEARYFVGYVGWKPGELKGEIDRGLWSVLDADVENVFRKDTDGLWEELLQQTRRIRADAPDGVRAVTQASQITRR
ncbi:MAG TPA: YqgE/AlgH family protein [Burkholderiales bacterium]|nr:YqgE/AlgH family protein [Burkholderiales bacterium]